MHRFTIDENKDGRYVLYKRFFWNDTTRLYPTCRLVGHKPTRVDLKYGGRGNDYFYECCRCGARPVNQSTPAAPWREPRGAASLEVTVWPPSGKTNFALNFRVGSSSSERAFKGHVCLGVVNVYWGLEGYGERLRRLLNDDHEHYDTRVIAVAWHDRKLWTELWARHGHSSRSDPWWMRWVFSPEDFVLGKTVTSSEVIATENVLVPMPEGSYPATAKLERWTSRRLRGRSKTRYGYSIEVDPPVRFVPVPGKGENSYDCGDDGVFSQSGSVNDKRAWTAEAVSGLTRSALRSRERYGSKNWTPSNGWANGLVKA